MRTLEVYGNTDRGNQRRCGKFVLYYLVTHFLVRKYKLLNQVGRLFQYCRLKYLPSCLLACVDRSFLSRRFGILHYHDPDHHPTPGLRQDLQWRRNNSERAPLEGARPRPGPASIRDSRALQSSGVFRGVGAAPHQRSACSLRCAPSSVPCRRLGDKCAMTSAWSARLCCILLRGATRCFFSRGHVNARMLCIREYAFLSFGALHSEETAGGLNAAPGGPCGTIRDGKSYCNVL